MIFNDSIEEKRTSCLAILLMICLAICLRRVDVVLGNLLCD
jgi:hypothetical protein